MILAEKNLITALSSLKTTRSVFVFRKMYPNSSKNNRFAEKLANFHTLSGHIALSKQFGAKTYHEKFLGFFYCFIFSIQDQAKLTGVTFDYDSLSRQRLFESILNVLRKKIDNFIFRFSRLLCLPVFHIGRQELVDWH